MHNLTVSVGKECRHSTPTCFCLEVSHKPKIAVSLGYRPRQAHLGGDLLLNPCGLFMLEFNSFWVVVLRVPVPGWLLSGYCPVLSHMDLSNRAACFIGDRKRKAQGERIPASKKKSKTKQQTKSHCLL